MIIMTYFRFILWMIMMMIFIVLPNFGHHYVNMKHVFLDACLTRQIAMLSYKCFTLLLCYISTIYKKTCISFNV